MRNVLITGVSTGIGEAIAAMSITKGYRVFGSTRKESDANSCSLKWGKLFVPLIMDLRDESAIKSNFDKVKEILKGEKLHVLVNNSGVAHAGPLELQDMNEIREMLEVNVLGVINTIQTFLPLMKQGNADTAFTTKIINISSGAGQLNIPFLGAYVASKHALEGLSGSLRRELMPFGIDVVVIGPGNVVTPIWDKAVQNTYFDESAYKKVFKNFFDFMVTEGRKGMSPEQIAHIVLQIMYTRQPKVRYAPVAQKFVNWYLPKLLPHRTMDKMLFKMLKMEKI